MSHIDTHPGAVTFRCDSCGAFLGGDNIRPALVEAFTAAHSGHEKERQVRVDD